MANTQEALQQEERKASQATLLYDTLKEKHANLHEDIVALTVRLTLLTRSSHSNPYPFQETAVRANARLAENGYTQVAIPERKSDLSSPPFNLVPSHRPTTVGSTEDSARTTGIYDDLGLKDWNETLKV